MERRKMLNMLGLGGLTSWSGYTSKDQMVSDAEVSMYFLSTFQDLQNNPHLQSGDLITTLGYDRVNDGGGGQYEILFSIEGEKSEQAIPGVFPIKNGLFARLINVRTVNYQLFGAKGDGKSDDGQAILTAHEFANHHRLPVYNVSGKYRIEKTRNIPVESGVQWGESDFYINEKYNTSEPVFHVRSRQEPVEILSNSSTGKAVIEQLRPGVQVIPELREYANHLIHLFDDQDRIAFRAGNYNQSGRAREELVYVSQEGRILGDVAWTFQPTVQITAYPAEQSFLEMEGGTFYLSGDTPEYDKSPYTHNGILVTRSRTRIRHQWVGIEKGREDESMTPRSGFYYFMKVYDVHLEDIRLIPREKNRPGDDRDVPHGTYGIGGNRVLELSLTGIVAEGTGMHWGVLGTNMMKNVKLTDCRINRFDVHFHLWNLTIRDCEIGYKGITVTGGGRLLVENTTVYQHRFISFRRDYGAKWDGDIYLSHCILRPPYQKNGTVLMNFQASDFNYGYPIGIARSIKVQDFVVNYTHVPDNNEDCWLMNLSDYSVTGTGERLFFPELVQFKDIRVRGRKKGVRIAHIMDCNGYQVAGGGGFDGDLFRSNSQWTIENVDLQEIHPGQVAEEQVHLSATFRDSGKQEIEPDSPHIELIIRNCPALSAYLPGTRLKLLASHTKINQLILQEKKLSEGEASFEYCDFVPVPIDQKEGTFNLDTALGTTFLNCVIHLPLVEGGITTEDLKYISFMDLNNKLLYFHMNTRISNGFIRFLNDNDMKLTKKYKRKMVLHSGKSNSS